MSKPLEEKWKLILIHQKSMFEQENSFKITGAPEYYIHVLKEAPTRESLQDLCKMLKTKPEEWIKKFLDLDGLTTIFAVLVATSEAQAEKKRLLAQQSLTAKEKEEQAKREEEKRKREEEEAEDDDDEEESEEEEEESAVTSNEPTDINDDTTATTYTRSASAPPDPFDLLQSDCIRAFRTLMNTNLGMNAFIKTRDKVCLFFKNINFYRVSKLLRDYSIRRT
jgi:hypothetical protein